MDIKRYLDAELSLLISFGRWLSVATGFKFSYTNFEKYRKKIPEHFKKEVFLNVNKTENMKSFNKLFTALKFLPQTGFKTLIDRN